MIKLKRYLVCILAALFVGMGIQLSFGQGPATNALNLRVRTDANGYLIMSSGAYSAADGPLTNFGNIRLKTDSNGYLLTTFGSAAAIGPVASITATTFGAFGPSPATVGSIRVAHGANAIVGRNTANSADLTIGGIDNGDGVSLGDTNTAYVLINSTNAGGLLLATRTFANLGSTAAAGTINFCSDCTETTPASCPATQASCVCVGSGSGAFARRVGTTWYCTF